MLIIEPISNDRANVAVGEWHRHNGTLPDLHLSFCYALYENIWYAGSGMARTELLGVAMVGNPSGRPMGPDRKLILEVRRVCFKPDTVFHKLRRYYHDKVFKDEMSLRTLPVRLDNLDGTQPGFQGSAIPAYTVPSTFFVVPHFIRTEYQTSNVCGRIFKSMSAAGISKRRVTLAIDMSRAVGRITLPNIGTP